MQLPKNLIFIVKFWRRSSSTQLLRTWKKLQLPWRNFNAAPLQLPRNLTIAARSSLESQLPTALKFDSATGNFWKRWKNLP